MTTKPESRTCNNWIPVFTCRRFRIAPKGEALSEAKRVAEELCKNGPLSIKALIKSLRENEHAVFEKEALERELEIGWPVVFESDDAKEGMRAFKEKREAVFQGK